MLELLMVLGSFTFTSHEQPSLCSSCCFLFRLVRVNASENIPLVLWHRVITALMFRTTSCVGLLKPVVLNWKVQKTKLIYQNLNRYCQVYQNWEMKWNENYLFPCCTKSIWQSGSTSANISESSTNNPIGALELDPLNIIGQEWDPEYTKTWDPSSPSAFRASAVRSCRCGVGAATAWADEASWQEKPCMGESTSIVEIEIIRCNRNPIDYY